MLKNGALYQERPAFLVSGHTTADDFVVHSAVIQVKFWSWLIEVERIKWRL